jgi:hypothetical protein
MMSEGCSGNGGHFGRNRTMLDVFQQFACSKVLFDGNRGRRFARRHTFYPWAWERNILQRKYASSISVSSSRKIYLTAQL